MEQQQHSCQNSVFLKTLNSRGNKFVKFIANFVKLSAQAAFKMSFQRLVELEDVSHRRLTTAEKDTDRDRPKPKPRSRTTKNTIFDDEQGVDDVIAISSDGSERSDNGKFLNSKQNTLRSFVSSFDNPTFHTDDEAPESSTHVGPSHTTKNPKPPLRKRTSNFFSSPSNEGGQRYQERPRSELSSNADESDNGNNKDDDNVSNVSNSTFTVENERSRYYDNARLDKKPPRPKSMPKKAQSKDNNNGNTTYIKSYSTHSDRSVSDHNDNASVKSIGKVDSPKKADDYLAVNIETDDGNPNPGDDNDNNGKTVVPDETDTLSISSATASKDTSKKSRFSKLFASSSGEKKKVEAKEQNKEKSGFVSRWRQKSHSFLKQPGKSADDGEPLEEEEVKGKKAGDDDDESLKSTKSKETKISMPQEDESGSEGEAASVKSTHTALEAVDKPSKSKSLFSRDRKSKAKEGGYVSQEKETEQEEPALEASKGEGKMSRFNPITKILRSRSKEALLHSQKSSKEDLLEDAVPPSQPSDSKESLPAAADKAKPKGKSWKSVAEKIQRLEIKEKGSGSRSHKSKRDSSSSTDEDELGTRAESESDDDGKKPKVKSESPLKKKMQTRPRDTLQLTDSAGKELLFGITIHFSDLLPLDPNVIHPVVKVSVMLQNGQFLKRSEAAASDQPEKLSKSSKRRNKDLKNENKLSSLSTCNMAESVLPIMSQPCKARHSIPTFAPTWNELLVFEEPFSRFALPEFSSEPDKLPIIFFEIMDFLPMPNNGVTTTVTGNHGTEPGWYKVAWAFLKPIGANGSLNLNKKLRLQLYKPNKLRSKEKLDPEIFAWWKCKRRDKLNCTLYVTPKGIVPPETTTASLRQLLSMRKEHLTQAILDSQLATSKQKQHTQRSAFEMREDINWTKMEGQSCKPPNKLVASLPSSQIESLNIVISGNVHCVKFSPCGTKLATGLDTDELHVVLLFEIPSWTLQKTLKGHHGIIYEIAWKMMEIDDNKSVTHLASASADSTVRIWRMQNNDEKTLALIKVLHHPSYVYCVKFHPTHPSILATGCFDYIIRIWDMKTKHGDSGGERSRRSKQDVKVNDVSPIIQLDKHSSFVNCLLFDPKGYSLFSADGAAFLFKWGYKSLSQKKSWKLDKDAKLHYGQVPINSIDLHPSGQRILVHLRDSTIKMLDVVTFIPLQSFAGLKNERFQIRSCFSPCGNLVLSGSEDSTLCIWDSDTGKILNLISPRKHPNCLVSCVDYHPFDYYVGIGLSSSISEPSPVLVYFYEQTQLLNYPLLKKAAQKMRQSLEHSKSRSGESWDGNHNGLEHRRNRSNSRTSTKRGDSTEKFISIIQKLDAALYLAQQRGIQRATAAAAPATCDPSNNTEEISKEQDEDEEDGHHQEVQNITSVDDTTPIKTHYIRKPRPRPRSASLITKKRERFRDGHYRAILSDSEQVCKLKMGPTDNKHSSCESLPARSSAERTGENQENVGELRTVDQDRTEATRPIPLKRRK